MAKVPFLQEPCALMLSVQRKVELHPALWTYFKVLGEKKGKRGGVAEPFSVFKFQFSENSTKRPPICLTAVRIPLLSSAQEARAGAFPLPGKAAQETASHSPAASTPPRTARFAASPGAAPVMPEASAATRAEAGSIPQMKPRRNPASLAASQENAPRELKAAAEKTF